MNMTTHHTTFQTHSTANVTAHAEGTQDTAAQLAAIEISHIVSELGAIREQALQQRQRQGHPPKLPSRKALEKIIEGLAAALYPNRLGDPDLQPQDIEFFVGATLSRTLRNLQQQLRLELAFKAHARSSKPFEAQVQALTQQLANQLTEIRRTLDTDLEAAFSGDPAAGSVDEVLVCYPGIWALIHHRIAHVLHGLGLSITARLIAEIAHSQTGIDIHPGARIGPYFFIDHGTGVVIGETAIIGQHVRLYQAVTLGAKNFPKDANGDLVKHIERHPILEDYVVVYAGATILGRITIGKYSVIGGNVWVTRNVPPNSHVTQAHSDAKPIPAAA